MAKNAVLGVYTIIIFVLVVLIAAGKLRWEPEAEADADMEDRMAVLERAIEMHRPEVLQMGDQEILHVPTSKLSGNSWSVNHEFYTYEDGSLKHIDFSTQ